MIVDILGLGRTGMILVMYRLMLLLLVGIVPDYFGGQLVLAEGFRGAQFFAAMAPSFPCSRALSVVNAARYPAMAVVWGTFGDSTSCIQSFLASNEHRPHLLEVHFSNESCRRKSRCLSGEFQPHLSVSAYNRKLTTNDLLPDVHERVMDIRRAIEPWINANTILVLSTGLEDNFSPGAFQAAYNQIRGAWPWTIVRSPVNRPEKSSYPGMIETHIVNYIPRKPCMFGEDGNRLSDGDSRVLLKKYKSCQVYLLWRRSWQNTEKNENRFVPPRLRSFEIPAKTIPNLQKILRGK